MQMITNIFLRQPYKEATFWCIRPLNKIGFIILKWKFKPWTGVVTFWRTKKVASDSTRPQRFREYPEKESPTAFPWIFRQVNQTISGKMKHGSLKWFFSNGGLYLSNEAGAVSKLDFYSYNRLYSVGQQGDRNSQKLFSFGLPRSTG